MLQDLLWTEKYRPKTVAECILPKKLESAFLQMVTDPSTITHMIFEGSPGTGKTSVARALANDVGADFMLINASNDRGIDTIRNEITQFSSTVSLTGEGRKVIVLDEADHLSGLAQAALRGIFEEFSKNTIYILTCNYKNKIMEAIQSRCAAYDFRLQKQDKKEIATKFHSRATQILKAEGIDFEPRVVAELVLKFMPDWRKLINELQKCSVVGKIDTAVLQVVDDDKLDDLVGYMKSKKYTEVRKWVEENCEQDNAAIYRKIYDNLNKLVEPACIPLIVTVIARYQYQEAFVADKIINLSAALAEIMVDAKWKS